MADELKLSDESRRFTVQRPEFIPQRFELVRCDGCGENKDAVVLMYTLPDNHDFHDYDRSFCRSCMEQGLEELNKP